MPNTPVPPVVELKDISVDANRRTILHRIDWSLCAGHHWGVIGANGSGKSTLLGLIAGTRWPAPGRGRRTYNFGFGPLTDAVEARQQTSLVGHELQDQYARHGWNFTVIDVVLSGVYRTDIPRQDPNPNDLARADALLGRLHLDNLRRRRFLELSRGEQRRVLIARGMAFEPAVLLLDEPSSGLDRTARSDLDLTITAASKTAIVVCAAHSADQLTSCITDVLQLHSGRVTEQWSRAQAEIPAQNPAVQQRTAEVRRRSKPTRVPRALITVSNANVWLGDRHVLRNLNWQLVENEHWLVTGRNGSGKSTFLRLLHGQLRPAVGGSITWPALGNPGNIWDLRAQIGFVSAELQAAYRYPTSVHDCIGSGFESSIGLTRRRTREELERVNGLIDQFELNALTKRFLDTLSYGQMHRVLIARTLVRRPRVLLLDEPWEGLDTATRTLVRDQLLNAMADGTQIVCVSHVGANGLPLQKSLAFADGGYLSADVTVEPA